MEHITELIMLLISFFVLISGGFYLYLKVGRSEPKEKN